MSFRLDLDEYDEMTLRNEIQRRVTARARGVCDYCGRANNDAEPPCKFPHRHGVVIRKKTTSPFPPGAGGRTP